MLSNPLTKMESIPHSSDPIGINEAFAATGQTFAGAGEGPGSTVNCVRRAFACAGSGLHPAIAASSTANQLKVAMLNGLLTPSDAVTKHTPLLGLPDSFER